MRAGALDRRLVVECRARDQNDLGEVTETWSRVAEIFAEVVSARAAERYLGAERAATVDIVFRVRYQPLLSEVAPDTHRLLYRGRVHNIAGMVEVGRKDGVLISCTARAEAGHGDGTGAS